MADVVVLIWPEEAPRGAELARAGTPVLYVVGQADAPPVPESYLEDWIRLPADDRDFQARVAVLEARAATYDLVPKLDATNRLHYRGYSVQLTSTHARIMQLLVDHFGETVSDESLQATKPGGESPRADMTLLRSLLRDLDLSLERVPRQGYALERSRGQ